jgi:hypothetical protein
MRGLAQDLEIFSECADAFFVLLGVSQYNGHDPHGRPGSGQAVSADL